MIVASATRVVGFLWFFYVSLFYYTEEFDNIEKESYLGSSAPPHPVREPKTLSVEVEANFITLYN